MLIGTESVLNAETGLIIQAIVYKHRPNCSMLEVEKTFNQKLHNTIINKTHLKKACRTLLHISLILASVGRLFITVFLCKIRKY